MQPRALTGRSRDEALRVLRESAAGGEPVDVLVVGGGVTGVRGELASSSSIACNVESEGELEEDKRKIRSEPPYTQTI